MYHLSGFEFRCIFFFHKVCQSPVCHHDTLLLVEMLCIYCDVKHWIAGVLLPQRESSQIQRHSLVRHTQSFSSSPNWPICSQDRPDSLEQLASLGCIAPGALCSLEMTPVFGTCRFPVSIFLNQMPFLFFFDWTTFGRQSRRRDP